MRLTVLGGCGAWPAAGQACSGYLVEHEGYRVFVDPGYATVPRLLARLDAGAVDAVLVSHGHPDHCADLNPLLRARALQPVPPPALPVYALPGALGPVLALDRPGMLADAYTLYEFAAGDRFQLGPFTVDSRALPHFVPNAGIRLAAGGRTLAYTGDCGPDPGVVALADRADLLLAEATHLGEVPDGAAGYLSTPTDAGRQAAEARVDRLVLTHLWPGTDAEDSRRAAAVAFDRRIDVALEGLVVDVD